MKVTPYANRFGREIVRMVEQKTGQEFSVDECLAIVAKVQEAINASTKTVEKPVETVNDWRPETRALLQGLEAAGFKLAKVDNGEERFAATGVDMAIAVLTATDESRLSVECPDGKTRWLYLVYGNSPGELVNDYSGGYDPLERAVNEVADAWEGRDQPTADREEIAAFSKAHYPMPVPAHAVQPAAPLPQPKAASAVSKGR